MRRRGAVWESMPNAGRKGASRMKSDTQIRVEVSDHTAKLYGHAHSLQEANAARAAAVAARGISQVESHLVISP
jgi:osmotically-inducible protein OsmY